MNGDIDLNDVPLSRLSNESRNLLSSLLNRLKVLKHVCPDRVSRYRDWRGLASLLNFSSQIEASIKEYPDRVGRVIEIWLQNDNYATIGQLMHYLQLLDRFDVYDDLLELLKHNRLLGSAQTNELMRKDPVEDDLITFEDVKHNWPQQYHAYVLFAPQDRDFVEVMMGKLRETGIKLCTEEELLPGFASRFHPVARLIAERCRRIILVYSEDFFQSSANTFLMQIAQAHGIESNIRNLVPIMYRQCELPRLLSHYHNLLYSPHDGDRHQLFWKKLVDTLHQAKPRGAYLGRLRNGMAAPDSSGASSGVRIQEVPSNVNGYIQYKPVADSISMQEQASSRFTPHKEEQRLALPEIPNADQVNSRLSPNKEQHLSLLEIPKPTNSGSITSLPTAVIRAQTEPLPLYNLKNPSSMSDINGDVKSKKKNRVERFISQVRAFPSKIGKKKKDVMVES